MCSARESPSKRLGSEGDDGFLEGGIACKRTASEERRVEAETKKRAEGVSKGWPAKEEEEEGDGDEEDDDEDQCSIEEKTQ